MILLFFVQNKTHALTRDARRKNSADVFTRRAGKRPGGARAPVDRVRLSPRSSLTHPNQTKTQCAFYHNCSSDKDPHLHEAFIGTILYSSVEPLGGRRKNSCGLCREREAESLVRNLGFCRFS